MYSDPHTRDSSHSLGASFGRQRPGKLHILQGCAHKQLRKHACSSRARLARDTAARTVPAEARGLAPTGCAPALPRRMSGAPAKLQQSQKADWV